MRRILPEHVLLIATCLCMAVVASLLMAVSASGAPRRTYTFTGKVVRVLDGDTIAVEMPLVTRIVRLNEIDAPEKNQPYGLEARQALEREVLNKTVTVKYATRDRYTRFLGTVTVEGAKLDINSWLVKEGAAWQYDAYSKSEELAKIEAEAREKRRGLWAKDGAIPPWKWRKGERE